MRVGPVVGVCALLVLVGCSGGTFNGVNQGAATASVAGVGFSGTVHGGQQPIVGAQVYMFAANTTGYAGPGIGASTSNASVSLLTSAGNTTLDTSGTATNGDYYVTTDANGNFSITGDYTCTAGQQVYLYAEGGNSGSGANSVIGLMAVLGNCLGGSSAFASGTPYVTVNEVTTVAAAYALAGFATDATHVSSSGTALALTGIKNAFANAANLASVATGTALTTTPAGNGTVPQTTINTLANILASCVNSNGALTGGTNATPCYTLTLDTLTSPANTAKAGIDMAHKPGSNVAGLYALGSATPPFAPALTVQPNDLTISLGFAGGGLSDSQGIALDAQGDVWVANAGSGSQSSPVSNLAELSSSGAFLSGANGFSNSGVVEATGVAIDATGDAWVASPALNDFASEFSSAGAFTPFSGGYGGGSSTNVAIDGSGNIWFGSVGYLYGYTSSGASVTGRSGGGLSSVNGIAIDGSGNEWATSSSGIVAEFSSSGSLLSGSSGYSAGGCCNTAFAIAMDSTGNAWVTNKQGNMVMKLSSAGSTLVLAVNGGLSAPTGIAMDGGDNVWVVNSGYPGSITEISNSGAIQSGSSGYKSSSFLGAYGIAVDGSGNVWATGGGNYLSSAGVVTEFVGVATPVITPIVAGLPATPTANGSSNLGTRP